MPLPFLASLPRAVPVAVAGAATVLLAACTPEASARAAAPATTVPAGTTAAAAAAGPASQPPAPSLLSIPSIGVFGLRVEPYEGTTDDPSGTRIQDRGHAASPYGERGGVGPGRVGNFLVTAHRMSAGGPLHGLAAVKEGDTVLVTAGGVVHTYEVVATRSTSFRSERSLAEQRAAVPGAPGQAPTQAMITISTCATPEDHAAGNYWSDAQGNPEHRIDKIGVLRRTTPAVPAPAGTSG
ncbi:sortase domain-bontaining protein [Streptomyces sp. NPDC101206]|uniref:sortase domain-containing protein n=1 Tax=Streptomyces sp. NPDC101206 TaxID=3366128 RepID=UPI003820494F